MAKKKLPEAVSDVKELNWDSADSSSVPGSGQDEPSPLSPAEFPGKMDGFTIHQVLDLAFRQIEGNLKEGNPVISWGIYPDHVNFVFCDGKKITIGL